VVVIHQTNQGVSAARNAGLKMAKGSYIGFVDSDDELAPDMYKTLVDTAEEHRADVAICGARKIFPQKVDLFYGTNMLKTYNRTEAIAALLKNEITRGVWNKLYKATVINEIKFEGSTNEDTFFNFLIFCNSDIVVFNDVIKYDYIIRDNSTSMAKFSRKHLDSILFSKRMLTICQENMPELVEDAMNFDFIINISLLNLILLSEKKLFLNEYKLVSANLKAYSNYVNKDHVKRKYKYAYKIFEMSPEVYEFMMRIYCRITDADVSRKNSY
jgi:glycosyltransferase involved in cell wall biosynthesis